VEFLIATILLDAVFTYVCFQKGKTGLAWVGVVGLFGLAPLLMWVPFAGLFGPPEHDSRWGLKKSAGQPLTRLQTPPVIAPVLPLPAAPKAAPEAIPLEVHERRQTIGTFLADARDRGVIDEETYRRLVAMLRPEVAATPAASTTPLITAPVAQPPPPVAAPVPAPPPQPVLTPPLFPVREPIVAAPSAPRVPSKAAQTRSRLWQALVSDVALHGFSYLGVLLTFVAVLGFLLFSFADLPDAAQPFVELIIALIFFGWAWFLRRQDAERVANGMELIGGMVLPLIVFASLVDNAPFPPDFDGGGLVVALALSTVVLAVLYSLYTARRPESVLRYLVAPLLWLAALTIGFAFKTDEPLFGDAITRLVSPQPALASVAIALSLLACQRRPENRLAQPTVISALIGLPVAYLITVALAFGEDWALTWPIVVLGAGTLVSAEILARWYHKESWVPLMRPLLLAGVLAPLTPSLELGWAGLTVAFAYVGLFELDRRLTPTAGVGQLLAGVGAVTGAVMAAADPWPALIVFTLLTAWAHLRRLESWEPPEIGMLFTAAAAVLPIGIGAALLQLIDPAVAWLVMAGDLALSSAVIRALKTEDSFWPIWMGAASLAVALGALDVWAQAVSNEVLGAPTLAVSALAISLLPRWLIARLWVAAALLSGAFAMALETAGVSSDQRSMAWAGLGLALVAAANVFRRVPASHFAAIGHLISAGSLLTLPSGSARSMVVGAWALGWVASTVGGELEGDSLSALLERSGSKLDGQSQTDFARASRWIAPILMVASIPVAVTTLASLWDEFAAHRSWAGVAIAGVSIVYGGVAPMVVSRRPLSRILATAAVVASLFGIVMSLPDSWPAIFSSAVMIAVTVLLGKELRLSWFVWAAWLVSVGLVALLGERAGVPDASLSQVTLVWGAVMLVGGLAADDILSTRRRPLEGLRVPWLQRPVLIGALVVPLSMAHVFLQSANTYGWWAIGAAAICFAVAFLLRTGSVTVLAYGLLTVGITALSPRSLLDEPWLYVIPAAVFVATAWIFERLQSSETAENDWLRWDLPPLVVAHLTGLFALGLTLEMDTVTPTALAFGVLSLVVGVWRRGRAWVEVGNLLILVAAYDAGSEWLALALAATSVRGVVSAWRSEGVERLVYQLIGAVSAGWAWLAVMEWQGYSAAEAVGYSALVFGGLTLGLGIAARIWEIQKDTLTVWGGLGVAGVVIAATTAFSLDQPETIGPWLALGLAMVAAGLELAWRRVDPALRLLTVGATGFAWLALVVGMDWNLSTSVRVTSAVFGVLAVVVAEVARLQPHQDEAERDNLGLPVARAWLGLAAAGVVLAALGWDGSAGDGYTIGLGLTMLSFGLARSASPLRLGRLREVAAITALAAINYAADSTGWSQSVIAVVLVVLAATATFSSLLLWRQQKTATWVTPLVVFAVGVNLETVFFAFQAWPDRVMAVAVLLSIGVQAVAIGTSRSLPGVLALGPPAVGLAFILAVGESVSGSALWYTVPIALVLLTEVEILRATRRAAGAPTGQDAAVLEWLGIGLLAAPPLVEMFTTNLIYGMVAFATAGAVLIWAVFSKVRRRAVTAGSLAIATAVLMIFAAASAAAPESAAFWILAGGIGFAVMLVAALIEAYRTRRGQVMTRLDQLMDGWE